METRLSLRHAHTPGRVCQVQAERSGPVFSEEGGVAVVSENTVRMMLTLLAPSGRSGGKWRFSDGSTNFSAAVTDEDFLSHIKAGGCLGKGDVLDVELRIRQVRAGGRIRVERTILRVLDHCEAARHLLLL